MNQVVITALLTLGLIIALMIYEMPFTYSNAHVATMELNNDPLIIAISDLHLESNRRDLGCIGNYLRSLGKDGIYLVINGDLFDRAHGQVLSQNHIHELIHRLNLAGINGLREVIYVIAMYDHDPRINHKEVRYGIDGVSVRVIHGVMKLVIGSRAFWFLHGDYVVKNGLIASLMNKLLNGSYDKLVRFILRAGRDDWVVIGHTHVPNINNGLRIANMGSWIDRFINATDTAIMINGLGNVELISIKCNS
ncbi:hypothetical protein [Vulcanisaeta sp. JCM 16159]|uniref:hypothetical protein n=1 Tax=Vulcanisaeta sp. JCM 16159 TaxID=1295371 RepID=UPI0006D26657|nr:hypothetical protein [Vulcanisaeta sp. JCM 16159]